MMAQDYALLYQRLDVKGLEQETVVAYYTDECREFGPFHYINSPLEGACIAKTSSGWQYVAPGGPNSIVLKRKPRLE